VVCAEGKEGERERGGGGERGIGTEEKEKEKGENRAEVHAMIRAIICSLCVRDARLRARVRCATIAYDGDAS
jgi:hypothetical protein